MGGMTPDWLAQLAPPHVPPPPGWWPPAPGWWALAILLCIAVAALIHWNRRPAVRLRRIALRELQQLEAAGIEDGELARKLEHLLRRYAVARFGHDMVAGLSGERWVAFVVAHGAADWDGDNGASLLRAAWGGKAEADRARWLSGARAFLKGRA
jgi:hypothetical protein